MGKIKQKLVRRTADSLLKEKVDFTEDFERNKKLLGNTTMPSKKIRNQVAGLLSKIKRREKAEEERFLESTKKTK